MPTITVNGTDLATLGVVTTAASRLHLMAARRAASVTVPGMHGQQVSLLEEPFEAGSVALALWLDGAGNKSTHDAKLDSLFTLFSTGAALDVRKTMMDGTVRQALCYVRASVEPEHRPGGWTKATVVLDIPGVFWRDVANTTFTQVTPGNGTTYTMTGFAGCTAPIQDGLILWTGPYVNPVVTDPYSGAVLTYAATINTGNQVLVNCATQTAITGTTLTFDSTSGTDVSGNLAPTGPGSAYRVWQVKPEVVGADPAVRRMRVTTGGTGTTAATKTEFRAKRAFI
jgi:hypothetical protein